MKEKIQKELSPEEFTESRVIFIKSYLTANLQEREELQETVISSSYMDDFIALCYAMWMVENNYGVDDIDVEYINLVASGEFKFFALPQNDTLGLKVASKLQYLEGECQFNYEKELQSFKENALKSLAEENPEKTQEEIDSMVQEGLIEAQFNQDVWSSKLLELSYLKDRCYNIYQHLMESAANDTVNSGKELKQVFNIKDLLNNKEDSIFDFDISEYRTIHFLCQKVLGGGDKQKVFYGNVELNCRTTEIVLFLTRNYSAQDELVEGLLMKDLGVANRFSRARRVLSALPYLQERSVNCVVKFLEPVVSLQSKMDSEFLESVLDSVFLPEDSLMMYEELLSPLLDSDLMMNLENQQVNENNILDYQMKIDGLFKEAVKELPNEVREKFDLMNKESMNFLNLNFESPELVTKESIKEKILSILSKMESNAHEDIDSLSSILYDWYSINLLETKLEEIQKNTGTILMENTDKIQTFEKMKQNALKPKIIFTLKMQEEIDILKEELPNFAEVIDFIITEVKLNLMYYGKMSFTPILLLGDAGLGKTYVAKKIAEILNTGFDFIDFGSTSASWILKGSSPTWRGASCGKVLELLYKSKTINPVILYDEIDKGIGRGNSYPPEVVLYQLFEKNNAEVFEDEFVGMPFDASSIINICTANTVNHIPAPLLSRLNIFKVEKLNQEQTKRLTVKMYKKMVQSYNIFNDVLSEDILNEFKELTPREIDRNLKSFMIQNVKSKPMSELLESRKNKIDLKKFDVVQNKRGTIGF